MRRLATIILLGLIAVTTTACIIEPPRGGGEHEHWCREHPYRCR